MIDYRTDVSGLTADLLVGFFEGWPNPPSPERLLQLLENAAVRVIAMDADAVVGFIYAISDSFAAYVPLLEVRPDYQGQGIGSRPASDALDQRTAP